jgi:hypothetical protein
MSEGGREGEKGEVRESFLWSKATVFDTQRGEEFLSINLQLQMHQLQIDAQKLQKRCIL